MAVGALKNRVPEELIESVDGKRFIDHPGTEEDATGFDDRVCQTQLKGTPIADNSIYLHVAELDILVLA
jgi:hypothetical protein